MRQNCKVALVAYTSANEITPSIYADSINDAFLLSSVQSTSKTLVLVASDRGVEYTQPTTSLFEGLCTIILPRLLPFLPSLP